MPQIPARCDVVVLGAGPAGLAAAWCATQRGLRVVVIDKAAHVGGLAGSMFVDGQSVDFGSHRLHSSITPELLHDLRGLGVDLQWRPRRGRIRLHDRWLDFPLQPLDLLRHAPRRFAARVTADTLAAPVRRYMAQRQVGHPKSFADATRRGLGGAITDAFYGPYARKLWAVAASDLSVELFRRRVSTRTSSALARKLLRRGGSRGFWYPALGFGAICDALADGVRSAAGVVATDSTVRSILHVGDAVHVTLSDGRELAARTVVSTVPPSALLAMLAAPAEVREAAAQLQFRGAVLLYLTVPVDRYTPFDAHYFPDATTIVSRLSEPKNYRTSSRDPADRSVVCAEIPASPGDEVWERDESVLAADVVRELATMGLPDLSNATSRVERKTHVYPVYRLGHEVHQRIVSRYLDDVPNLIVVGRQATFAHDNTHHALLMGKAAASSLRDDGLVDRQRWRRAREAFVDHVVED